MEPWLAFTLGAAVAQTARFMLQKRLKQVGLSNAGATFARFVYSAPILLAVLGAYCLGGGALPAIPAQFWPFAILGGAAQILATICVVAVFSHRNFAVGITLKKSEVVITALIGFVVLGDSISWIGGLAIGIGLAGVLLLSDPPGGEGRFLRRIWNPAAGLGLLSGLFFAVSAVGYGGATRSLEGALMLRAGLTLGIVTLMQTMMLGAWMAWQERAEFARVFAAWRISGAVGVTSMIGSFCWFSAFAIQNVTYVFAVGQVELILSILASALVFKEVISRREYLGIGLLAVGILVLVVYL